MSITKKTADEFLSHLQVPSVSIPDIQEEMGISYRDARNLIEYAIKRRWVFPCTEGNEYKTNPSAFNPKSLTPTQCQKFYDELSGDALNVLYYFAKNNSATFDDILENVDDDDDDMHDAIETLIASHILVECSGNYYCNISTKSIEKIKSCSKKNDLSTRSLRRMLGDLE